MYRRLQTFFHNSFVKVIKVQTFLLNTACHQQRTHTGYISGLIIRNAYNPIATEAERSCVVKDGETTRSKESKRQKIYRSLTGEMMREWMAKKKEKKDTLTLDQALSLSPDVNLFLSLRTGSISHAF